MKKFIIFLISFFLIVGCESQVLPTKKDEKIVTDGITFKTEYENLNSVMKDDFSIEKENPFKYLTKKNIEEVFKTTNIVFIGNASDINSRVIVTILNDIAKEKEIESIYYLDSLSNFAKYEINVNGQIKSQEESELYKLVLSEIKGLEELYSPSIIFIKEGNISDYYIIDSDIEDNAIDSHIINTKIIELIEKLDA